MGAACQRPTNYIYNGTTHGTRQVPSSMALGTRQVPSSMAGDRFLSRTNRIFARQTHDPSASDTRIHTNDTRTRTLAKLGSGDSGRGQPKKKPGMPARGSITYYIVYTDEAAHTSTHDAASWSAAVGSVSLQNGLSVSMSSKHHSTRSCPAVAAHMFCKVVWRVVSTISAKVQDAELVVFKAVGVEGRCGFCGKENQNS